MLGIERDAVKWEAYAGAHHIQERQIVVIAHYLENLGTQVMLKIAFAVARPNPMLTCSRLRPQSMLICGFAFGSLFGGMMELPPNADEEWSEAWFMITVCISCGLMFFVIVASTLVASLGPQMALRGEDAASMRLALEYMKSYRKYIVRSFAGGCAAFFIVVLQIGWQKVRRRSLRSTPLSPLRLTPRVDVADDLGDHLLLGTSHRASPPRPSLGSATCSRAPSTPHSRQS